MSLSPARREHLDGLAILLLMGCSLIWGLNQVAAKLALPEVPPLTQAALRSAGAAVLVIGWALWRGVPLFQRDGTLRAGLLAGSLFALEFALIFGGLQFTSASRMAVFIYLSPFVVALGMPLIARNERLAPLQWCGLAIAFGGVALALAEGFAGPTIGPRQWWGDLMGVGAAVLWGATTLVIRASALSQAAAEKTLVYQLLVSALLLGLAALWIGNPLPVRWSAIGWGSMLFQTVVVCFASYLTWFWLMRHYPATRISTFVLLTPVAGLLFGVVLLREPLTWQLLLALAAVVAGISLVNRKPAAAPATPSASKS
ncbi:MAG: DMT family transporter [Rubrivivax sp.]|nr:DMT family transporter [Rubrivivax sp.]